VALLHGKLPGEVLAHWTAFQGERVVERTVLGAQRCVATHWLGEPVMLGGLDMSEGAGVRRPGAATMHWKIAGERSAGWLRLAHDAPALARAK